MIPEKCPTCGQGLSAKYRATGVRHVYRVSRARVSRHPGLATVRRLRIACPWVPS